MNILPKKRWHVRTKDNVARVRRDQAQAREEEQRRLERAALAEGEARTSFLRQRASAQRQSSGGDWQTEASSSTTTIVHGHVNFFADLEEQERTFGTNKEYEKEKKLEKEKEERKIGLLKYLGEGSSEYTKEVPWYQKVPARESVKKEATVVSTSAKPSISSSTTKKPESQVSSKRKKKESMKHKKKRRRHSSSSSTSSSSNSDAKTTSAETTSAKTTTVDIEKLRNERLRREREERLKAEALLRKARGEPAESGKANVSIDQKKQYEQRYSSQFNPDLARQNRLI